MNTVYGVLCGTDANQCTAVWTGLTAIAAALAAVMAFLAFKSQVGQAKTDLWRSLSQEFDHVLCGQRRLCGVAYQNGLLNTGVAQKILDFFETLSYLIRNYRLDEELAAHTFAYYFSHYYIACQESLKVDRALNPSCYADLEHLALRWRGHLARVKSDGLAEFFDLESRYAMDNNRE